MTKLDLALGVPIVDEWIRSLRVVSFDAANLYLEADNSFQIHWFEEHIRPRLKNTFVNNNLRPIAVHIKLASFEAPSKKTSYPQKNTCQIHPDPLEEDFTFKGFLPSENNLIAHGLFQQLADGTLPLATFNPLLIYGPKGSGKTHLLTAIAHALQLHKKVFFVKTETFTEHVVQSIRSGSMQAFRQLYREIEVLIVDDVHLLARKNATQEEFFHTFNTLHTSGLQIFLSANAPPSQLTDIEPRLISRFEWGLSAALGPPKNIREILELKARLWKLSISSPIFEFILQEIPSKPIDALQALALRAGQNRIDFPGAKNLLKDFVLREKQEMLTAEQIIQAVAKHFGIRPEDLLGKSQAREFVLPRQLAMYSCREQLKMAFQAIGKLFGRDHSTVMASVKQIQKGIEENKQDLTEAMRSLCKELKS
ncbi:MAG: ATP-binding protein [Chlamydiae bacterium]|nr:ATP-binding protein [Chlamydiota bacterium]